MEIDLDVMCPLCGTPLTLDVVGTGEYHEHVVRCFYEDDTRNVKHARASQIAQRMYRTVIEALYESPDIDAMAYERAHEGS